ncbi:MAG TPA: TlpA disulfide reductase family protein [Puia sp.]|nr:TlpA disulfide reductase family protein [Puia sp.]
MLKFPCLLFLYISTLPSYSQTPDSTYPEVGRKMPDFVLRNINYYPLKTAALNDFKGKWLVLDFWNKSCGACVASFTHVDQVQKELGDRVQVMLVGIQDKEGEIAPMYKKFREHLHLMLPCAFDSAIANRFDIYAAPHSIVIDDKGIVRSITGSITVQDMKMFLDGNTPSLPIAHRMSEHEEENYYPFDHKKPLLIGNNGGQDTSFLFRSILSSWASNTRDVWSPRDIGEYKEQGFFQAVAVSLEWLYYYAYFGVAQWNERDTMRYGKFFNHLIVESKDSNMFRYSYKYVYGLYSYSCMMPRAQCTKLRLENSLRNDLKSYFGFYANIERRKCPYWKLVATSEARKKITTKGGNSSFRINGHLGFSVRNRPMSKLVDYCRHFNSEEIIMDETGIVGNIDIDLECVPSDLNDLRMALEKNGLILIKDRMDMNAIVIKDTDSTLERDITSDNNIQIRKPSQNN